MVRTISMQNAFLRYFCTKNFNPILLQLISFHAMPYLVTSQVMREFPEPDAYHECQYEVLPALSPAPRGTRKRHRPGTQVEVEAFFNEDGNDNDQRQDGNYNDNGNHNDNDDNLGDGDDDDAWLAGEGAGGEGVRWKEAPFSPSQLTAAKSAAVAAAEMAEARTDTPDRRALAQPPDRKRVRSRPSPSPSPSPAAAAAAAAAVAVGGTAALSSFRKLASPKILPTSGAGGARASVNPMESPPPRGDVVRKQGARADRNSRTAVSTGTSSTSSDNDSGRPGGMADGEAGAMIVGDEAGTGWASRDGDGGGGVEEGFRVAVAVTPQENSLPPPDPSLMRECLDEYMEVSESDGWLAGSCALLFSRAPSFSNSQLY